MGARVYFSTIGRFAQVDPEEGGVENNYVYPPDPVNEFDLNGQWGSWKSHAKSVTRVAAVGAMMPGPVGMTFAAVQATTEITQGNWKGAAVALGGIALAGAGVGAVKFAPKIKDAVHISAFSKTTGINSKLFGKGGVVAGAKLNKGLLNNNIIRIGWSWKGTAKDGKLTFRAAIGSKSWTARPHIDIRSYKPISKKWYR